MLYNINLKEDERYFFISGYLKALENKLLKESDFADLVELPIKNLFNILIEKGYRLHGDIEKTTYEMIFEWEIWHLKKIVSENCDQNIFKLFFFHYDLPNIKKIIKAKHLLKINNPDDLYFYSYGIYEPKEIVKIIFDESYEKLEFPELAEFIVKFLNENKDNLYGEIIDIEFERFYFNYLLNELKSLKNKILLDIFEKRLFLLNLKNLIRLKQEGKDQFEYNKIYIPGDGYGYDYFIDLYNLDFNQIITKLFSFDLSNELIMAINEYIKNNDLGLLERIFDDLLTIYVREMTKYLISDLTIIYSFIYAKEIELKNIKIIYVSKINNISQDKVKKILRKTYV